MSRGFYWALGLVGFVAIVGLAAFVWWARATADEGTYIPKPEVITPEIELLQAYVRIDTSNPPGNETEGARFLIEELARRGVDAELIESAPGRGNVYARLKGRRAGEGLLLLHHIDVVPADASRWKHPPFEARIEMNMMYGRGTLDMKSIGIAHLEAFSRLASEHPEPERDVVFLATADEEHFGRLGLPWLIEHRPDIFEGIRYAVTEGGVTETIAERLSYFGIETGSKQFVGAIARSSTREDLEKLRIALEPYFNPRDPERVLPEVRDFFTRVAPHRKEPATLLADIDRTIAEGKFWLLDPSYRQLTQNNVGADRIVERREGYSMRVGLLNLPDEVPEERFAWLNRVASFHGVTIEPTLMTGPTKISSPQTPLFALIARHIRSTYGEVPVGPRIVPSITTDCRFLRARGIDCYGMWPFPVNVYQTWGIHRIDERVRLDWFQQGVEMTAALVQEYATVTKNGLND
ncbi:MAG TPA: M20/M25/M40 family metallo-hydrolase [Thermoanaerobaculia bacterium]|nr:M20/M25/M40 family metallo-hydrolase [Thermoanaerobaculia bacterium]